MNAQDPITSTNPCDTLRDLLPAYALGAVDPDEAHQIEALLPHCSEWRAEIAAYEQLGGDLAALVPPVMPPPSVKAGLMRAVAARSKVRRPAWGWIAAACLLIALVVSNAAWAALATRPTALELVLPAAQTDLAPNARGRVLWTRAEPQAVLVLSGLPLLPVDQTYQAWVRAGERVHSLGVFQPQADGHAMLIFDGALLAQPFDTVGVTIEPAGGSAAPSSPPIVRWRSG